MCFHTSTCHNSTCLQIVNNYTIVQHYQLYITLHITFHLESPVLYFPEPDDAILLMYVAHFYVKSRTKTTCFNRPSFYSTPRVILLEVHKFNNNHNNHPAVMDPSFLPFITAKLHDLQGKSHSVRLLFLTTKRLVKYRACDKKKQRADSSV